MSVHAMPFLVVNLGCEIIYVIDQRLRAQDIAADKSEKVLTDITSVLLNEKLLEELFAPQPVATHAVVRQLLLDISSSSIMRLDEYSAGKLWELATMIFKWQIATATSSGEHDIFNITRRHLRGVASLVPQYFPCQIFDRARKRFDAVSGKISAVDFENINCAILSWLSEYQTKISVLLRLGLQNKDGKFIAPVSSQNILNNLGDNIYTHDTKSGIGGIDSYSIDTFEISCLLSNIVGTVANPSANCVELRLPIEFGGESSNKRKGKILKIQKETKFETVKTDLKKTKDDLMFDLQLPKSTQEDLLTMLDNDL